jgi:hypothetical protein
MSSPSFRGAFLGDAAAGPAFFLAILGSSPPPGHHHPADLTDPPPEIALDPEARGLVHFSFTVALQD